VNVVEALILNPLVRKSLSDDGGLFFVCSFFVANLNPSRSGRELDEIRGKLIHYGQGRRWWQWLHELSPGKKFIPKAGLDGGDGGVDGGSNLPEGGDQHTTPW